jgi:hypothetical protein
MGLNNCITWWAGQDSNLQPDRYERPALTIELPARSLARVRPKTIGRPGKRHYTFFAPLINGLYRFPEADWPEPPSKN